MRRRLSRRERRLLIVFGGLLMVGLVSWAMAPEQPANTEEVIGYYQALFRNAEAITIRIADGGGEAVTATRAEHPKILYELEHLATLGGISLRPSGYSPKYLLDIKKTDGKLVRDVAVSFHIESPKQPSKGKLWLFPRAPGPQTSEPAMVAAIDRFIASLSEPVEDVGSDAPKEAEEAPNEGLAEGE